MWSHIRHIRFADGPDEAHAQQLARSELKTGALTPPHFVGSVVDHINPSVSSRRDSQEARGLCQDDRGAQGSPLSAFSSLQ